MSRRRRRQPGDPKYAVAYMRVSKDEQRPELQRDAIESWAAANDVRIAAWCVDHGVSGAAPLDERVGLLEAIAALGEHGAGLLLAARRDRLARDVAAAAAVESLVRGAGASIVTTDGLDPSDTPEGQLIRTLIDAFAQYERALIRARTRAALRAKRTRGEKLGGEAPYGWRAVSIDPPRLEIDNAEQAAIARMRELHALGATQREIATALETEGFRPRGARWHATTVARVLRNAR